MTTLPDGLTATEDERGRRTWLRGDYMLVAAEPFPIPGFSQNGWTVTLVSHHGATTITIRYDELEPLAAWHCRSMADVLDTVVKSA